MILRLLLACPSTPPTLLTTTPDLSMCLRHDCFLRLRPALYDDLRFEILLALQSLEKGWEISLPPLYYDSDLCLGFDLLFSKKSEVYCLCCFPREAPGIGVFIISRFARNLLC